MPRVPGKIIPAGCQPVGQDPELWKTLEKLLESDRSLFRKSLNEKNGRLGYEPIGSVVWWYTMVYLAYIFTVKINHECRSIWYTWILSVTMVGRDRLIVSDRLLFWLLLRQWKQTHPPIVWGMFFGCWQLLGLVMYTIDLGLGLYAWYFLLHKNTTWGVSSRRMNSLK